MGFCHISPSKNRLLWKSLSNHSISQLILKITVSYIIKSMYHTRSKFKKLYSFDLYRTRRQTNCLWYRALQFRLPQSARFTTIIWILKLAMNTKTITPPFSSHLLLPKFEFFLITPPQLHCPHPPPLCWISIYQRAKLPNCGELTTISSWLESVVLFWDAHFHYLEGNETSSWNWSRAPREGCRWLGTLSPPSTPQPPPSSLLLFVCACHCSPALANKHRSSLCTSFDHSLPLHQ